MICRLTVCTPGSASDPMLGNEYGRPFAFLLPSQYVGLIGIEETKLNTTAINIYP